MYGQEVLLPSLAIHGNTNYVWNDVTLDTLYQIAQTFGDETKLMKIDYLRKVVEESGQSFNKHFEEVNHTVKNKLLTWHSNTTPDGLFDRPIRQLLRALLVHYTG